MFCTLLSSNGVFSLPIPLSIPVDNFQVIPVKNYSNDFSFRRCFSGGRSGGSRWNLDANVNNPSQSRRLGDAYLTEDYGDEGESGFRDALKKRVWWYDDLDGEEDEEEEEKDAGFGVREASISFKWISKVLRSFGWMIPAVITSLVLGTGTDSIFMALALPLAQSVFSLITETLWKRSTNASRAKSKSKKRPARATSNMRSRKTRKTNAHTRPEKRAGDYMSWVASGHVSTEAGKRNPGDFGGWDELDNQTRVEKASNIVPEGEVNIDRVE